MKNKHAQYKFSLSLFRNKQLLRIFAFVTTSNNEIKVVSVFIIGFLDNTLLQKNNFLLSIIAYEINRFSLFQVHK